MIPARKSDRLNLRVSPVQRTMIRRAAANSGVSYTDFILDAATEKATEVLADHRLFMVGSNQWDRFVSALEAPATPVPALVALFRDGEL